MFHPVRSIVILICFRIRIQSEKHNGTKSVSMEGFCCTSTRINDVWLFQRIAHGVYACA